MTDSSEIKPPTDIPRYRAFISYRHAEVDSAVAGEVQRRLERFWVPRSARGASGSARIAPVFRDKEELPVSSRLGDDIEAALRGADALVVICSPRTQESSWVAREIDTFLRWHDQDHVFVVLAEGEPYDVIPERLLFETRTIVDSDGSTREETVEIEPLACDFRSAARRERRTELTRLAAAILDVSFDSLVHRTQRRRIRLMAGAMVLITAVALYALWSAARIREQYRQTQINESEALAIEAHELLDRGDRMEAIQVALAALPKSSTSHDRPLVPAAQQALEEALQVYPSYDLWRACYSVDDVSPEHAFSAQGLQAMRSYHDVLIVSRIDTGEEVSRINLFDGYYENRNFYDSAFGFCGEYIYAYSCSFDNSYLIVYDSKTGKELWHISIDNLESRDCIISSNDGTKIAVCNGTQSFGTGDSRDTSSCSVTVFSVNDGSVIFTDQTQAKEIPVKIDEEAVILPYSSICASFSPDDTRLAIATTGQITLFDIRTGDANQVALDTYYIHDILLRDDRLICTAAKKSLRSYDQDVYVYAFDASLARLWNTTIRCVWAVDGYSQTSSSARISRIMKSYQQPSTSRHHDDVDIIMAGCDVIVYEHQSGSIINRFTLSSTVMDCYCNKGGMLYIIDTLGYISPRSIGGNQLMESIEHYYDRNIERLSDATFIIPEATNTSYLAVYRDKTNRQNIFRLDPHITATSNSQRVDSLENVASMQIWDDHPWIAFNKSMIEAVDPSTFEQLWSHELDSFDVFESTPSIYSSETSVFLCARATHPITYRIVRLSRSTGEQIDSFVLDFVPEGSYSIEALYETELDGQPCLVVIYQNEVRFYNLETHQPIFSLPETLDDRDELENGWSNQASFRTDNYLVLLQRSKTSTYLRKCKVLSLKDGHEVLTVLQDYPLSETIDLKMGCIVNEEESLLSLVGSDHRLRLFDLHTESLVWESDDVPTTIMRLVYFAPQTNDIVLQDLSGRLSLISRSNGRVLRTSTEKLEPIIWCRYGNSADSSIVAGYQQGKGTLSMRGLALIESSEDTFGLSSIVPKGCFITTEDGVIASDYEENDYYVLLHHHSLDELISLAHETIKGHELSNAERHLYRIGP